MRSPWGVLLDLYDREISAGLEADWDGGFRVWIGNDYSGHIWEEWFGRDQVDQIAGWLERHARIARPPANEDEPVDFIAIDESIPRALRY